MNAQGRATDATWQHCYHAKLVEDEDLAEYVAKITSAVDAASVALGLEVAGGVLKGRNLVRLLAEYAHGDEQSGDIWRSGVADVCVRKVASVRWSPKLRGILGLAVERTDEEIAAERAERSDELLGELRPWQWRQILSTQNEFALVTVAQIGRDAVNTFLAGISAGELNNHSGEADPERE